MTNKTTSSVFGKLNGAAKTAFDRAAQMGGSSEDSDLRLYDTLQESDFDRILQQYGADETVEYIRRMESRKLIGGKHG